jgi:hypothetical protein
MATYSGALNRTFLNTTVNHTPSGGGVNGVVIATAAQGTYVDVDVRTFEGVGGSTGIFTGYFDIQKKIDGVWFGVEVANGADVAWNDGSSREISDLLGTLSTATGVPVAFLDVGNAQWRDCQTEIFKAADHFKPIRLGPDERLVLATQSGSGTMKINYATITYSSSL